MLLITSLRKTSIKRQVLNKRRVSNKRLGSEACVQIKAGCQLNAGSQVKAGAIYQCRQHQPHTSYVIATITFNFDTDRPNSIFL